MKQFYVNVRLKSDDAKSEWKHEWRKVESPTLGDAVLVAKQMPDVVMCLEASVTPGGVVT